MSFKKILVANRGEIAVRIIRAAKELGIRTVAVYSEVDRNSLHLQFADEAVCIGPAPSQESYLNIPQIISAALITGVEAIHPGYGFLAENAKFAEICESHKISFIGPNSQTITKMGDKIEARRIMKHAGIPIIPGSTKPVESLKDALRIIEKIDYPIIIKAAAGGGGKGVRIVWSRDKLERALEVASAEANASFKNPTLYIERYLHEPRHIEIQILADNYGNVIHLGERECSIQHRHQKLIEESPSPAVDDRLRAKMGEAALKAAKAVKYSNVGTVEFLLDKSKNFYFIEMNTRIQVEHPVTETVTGIDLVKEQILLASGKKIRSQFSKKDINLRGHAIECRINATDPDNGFSPCSGKIHSLILPSGIGVRIDTHLYPGYTVPPNYDSLIAKIITYGLTREEAIARMKRALEECVIEGIKTTIPFHQKVLTHDAFKKGEIHTHFLPYVINV
ncbi:MAG: acetyl-CoA carboxylase biotin carboxylase subunit [bacterium]